MESKKDNRRTTYEQNESRKTNLMIYPFDNLLLSVQCEEYKAYIKVFVDKT